MLTDEEISLLKGIEDVEVLTLHRAVPEYGGPMTAQVLEWERDFLEREAWDAFRKRDVVPVFRPTIEEEVEYKQTEHGYDQIKVTHLRLEAYTRPLPSVTNPPVRT